ncbi:MAG: hypothetical protein FWG65_03540 [Turicibacter sp.]|nr:hypothetical protein [Turicibacter sp.]
MNHIRTNVNALNAHRNLLQGGARRATASERLSSGLRINKAADDAAGLGISEKMRAIIRSTGQSIRNIRDGISVTTTADGALQTINDILIRIRELTIQSLNDTNSSVDRTRIEDEIWQLHQEIERIGNDTEFNTIRLFRMAGIDLEIPEEEYERVGELRRSHATESPNLVEWGWSPIVDSPHQLFNFPNVAERASVTMTLDNDITYFGEGSGAALHGKSILIGGQRFNFLNQGSGISFPVGNNITNNITIFPNDTVDDVLQRLTQSPHVAEVEVNEATRQVTFRGGLVSYTNRQPPDYPWSVVENADGRGTNDVLVKSVEGNNLRQITGEVGQIAGGNFEHGTTAEGEFRFTLRDVYTTEDIDNLVHNRTTPAPAGRHHLLITRPGNVANIQIFFARYDEQPQPAGPTVTVFDGMTAEEMQDAIIATLNAHNDISVANPDLTPLGGGLNRLVLDVTLSGLGAAGGQVSLHEVPVPNIPQTGGGQIGGGWSDVGTPHTLNITAPSGVTSVQTSSIDPSRPTETADRFTITVPQNLNVPSTITIGGNTIVLYNSSTFPEPHNGQNLPDNNRVQITPTGANFINTENMTPAQIQSAVLARVHALATTAWGGPAQSVTTVGNTVQINGMANTPLNVSVGVGNATITSNIQEQAPTTTSPVIPAVPGSTAEIRASLPPDFLEREVSLPINLAVEGGNIDIPTLGGTGFTFMDQLFEFRVQGDPQPPQINQNSTVIDIAQGMNAAQIALAMEDAIAERFGALRIQPTPTPPDMATSIYNSLEIEPGANGLMTITFMASTGIPNPNNPNLPQPHLANTFNFTNGSWQSDGIFSNNQSVSDTFTGGTLVDRPSTTVNFAGVNPNELMGSGFRIYCASCPDEFVNVIFVPAETTGDIPEYFYLDPPSDHIRVNNFIVRMADGFSPAALVSQIVDQLQPVMEHFSWVRVDPNNPSALIVEDWRRGDLPDADPNGTYRRGHLVPGVWTNFTLDIHFEGIYERINSELPEMEFSHMWIHSGPMSNQGVNIPLPQISLNWLGLFPSEPSMQTKHEMNLLLERVDRAAEVVTRSRTVIGAMQNRLEWTDLDMGVYEENLSAANSRIRDADMALEMMRLTQENFLNEAASLVLAQANQMPQVVLQLLEP